MRPIDSLAEYVRQHARRGTCRCGRCFDRPGEDKQPQGHTADVVFFAVSAHEADAETLRQLVSGSKHGEFCEIDLLDGEEHNYTELGAWIGDQGLALMLMGLGTVLGLWKLLTPKTMFPAGIPDDLIQQMAEMGMVAVMSEKPARSTQSNKETAPCPTD